jgi:hypothetical protein
MASCSPPREMQSFLLEWRSRLTLGMARTQKNASLILTLGSRSDYDPHLSKPCDRHFPSNFNRKQQLSPRRLGQPDDFCDAPVSYDGVGEQECLSTKLTFQRESAQQDFLRDATN